MFVAYLCQHKRWRLFLIFVVAKALIFSVDTTASVYFKFFIAKTLALVLVFVLAVHLHKRRRFRYELMMGRPPGACTP